MKTITLVKDDAKCAGCGACMTACPVQAISMEMNTFGHLYPKISADLCIQCGKCVETCDFAKPTGKKMPLKAYAAAGKNDKLVHKSASGGVFATLAAGCLASGGKIAGAVMDFAGGQANVYHILSSTGEDLGRMQGSKYVQSKAWRCYQDVVQAVSSGEEVLFSGTPCQVAAVKKLTGDPDNLITVDLVCHGVPSEKILNEYLQILSKRFGGSIVGFQFRDKSCDKQFCAKINVAERKRSYILRSHYLSFYKHFLEGEIYRESCYACPYASMERVSDITIGDYWGIEAFHGADITSGRMPHREDWSCVLVNTGKGKNFLEKHSQHLALYPTQAEWIAQNNQQLRSPSLKGEKRDAILDNYSKGGYGAVEAQFVRSFGGPVLYYLKMLKNLRANQKSQKVEKKCQHED